MMSKRTERLVVFIFGVIFLVAILVIALILKNPTSFQYFVFRTVLALSVAGVVGFIPGFLSVEWKGYVRASGAIAAFVFVYLVTPAALPRDDLLSPEESQNQLAYDLVFGQRPRGFDATFPLDGAKLGPRDVRDSNTGESLKELFARRSLKVVFPYYTWAPCPQAMWDSIWFKESLEPFLNVPIDLIFVNIDQRNPPNKVEIDRFFDEADLPENRYFFVTDDKSIEELAKSLALGFYDGRNKGAASIDMPTFAIVYSPSGKPLSVVPSVDPDAWQEYRDFLYRLVESDPLLINRERVPRRVPRFSVHLVTEAKASPQPPFNLRQSVGKVSENRGKMRDGYSMADCKS